MRLLFTGTEQEQGTDSNRVMSVNKDRGGSVPFSDLLQNPAVLHLRETAAANFPWRSHADWFLQQMVRWGQAPADIDIAATADRVYRTDLYRAAAREMGVACPDGDRLPPGGHGEPLLPPMESKPREELTARLRSGEQP